MKVQISGIPPFGEKFSVKGNEAMKKTRSVKKCLSLLLAVLMVFTMLPAAVSAASTDIAGHWAEETLLKWTDLGWLSGDGGGTYRPNDGITRAEFMSLINRMKGYTGESPDIAMYTDVSPDKWYYSAVSTALAAGYITGTGDTTVSPENPITRQEAMTIIARVSGVSSSDTAILSAASDCGLVASWARESVAACINEGLVAGSGGKINPLANITRAESVVLMDRVYSNIRTYAFAGTYGPESGTLDAAEVNLAGSGVRLRNVTVAGDLTIGAAVGTGEVYLDGVTVGGALNVQGGGLNSVYLSDCNIKELVVSKDSVRVVLDDGSVITYALAEGDNNIIEIKGNTKIETLTVVGDDTRITAEAGVSITTLNAEADGTKLETQSGTTIGTANITGSTEITGQGSIATANIKSDNVTIEKAPATTNVDSGLTANVGGKEVSGTTTGGNTGGGGENNSGGNVTTPTFASHNVANKTVPFGTQPGSLNLPASVTLTANTGATGTADVVWSYNAYNPNTVGAYTITGTLSNATVTWAPTTITVSVTVQAALTVTGGTSVADVIIKSTDDKAAAMARFPQTLTLTLSDNSSVQVTLTWTCDAAYSNIASAENSFTAAVSGLPATVATAPAITAKVIVAASDTPVATSVELLAIPQSAQRPAEGESEVVSQLGVTVYDQFGDAIQDPNGAGLTLKFSLPGLAGEDSTKITVDANDQVLVAWNSVSTSVTARVSIVETTNLDNCYCEDEVTIYITDEPVVATSIGVTDSVSSMTLPVSGQTTTYTFAGVVKDQKGTIMAGESVTWGLKAPVTGVSITAGGLVTVLPTAADGAQFIIVASSGMLTSVEKTVTISKAASVATIISTIIGNDSITLPVPGASAANSSYSAHLIDQYGTAMAGIITWHIEAGSPGVSVDSYGTVSITDAVTAQSATLSARYTGLADQTKMINIVKAASVATTVTVSPATPTVTLPAINPAAGADATQALTVEVKDQYGVVIADPTVTWSIPATTGVSVNASGLLTVTSAASPGTVAVTATSGGKTGTASLTIEKASPVAATVEVSPATASVTIPATGSATQQFAATVKDQYGAGLTPPSIEWSVTSLAGVSINASSGLLTVASNAAGGTVTVTATYEGKTGTASVTVTSGGETEPLEKLATPTGVTVFYEGGNMVWVYWDAANEDPVDPENPDDPNLFDDRAYWLHAIPVNGDGQQGQFFGTMEPAFKNEFPYGEDEWAYYPCLNIEIAEFEPGAYQFAVVAYKDGFEDSDMSALSEGQVQIVRDLAELSISSAVYDEIEGTLTITSEDVLTDGNSYMIDFYDEDDFKVGSVSAYIAETDAYTIVFDIDEEDIHWIEFSDVASITVTTWSVEYGTEGDVVAVITYTSKQAVKILVTQEP